MSTTEGKRPRKPPPAKGEPEDRKRTKPTKSEIADLLDEIDEVLEKNTEDFVKGFVQKGGE